MIKDIWIKQTSELFRRYVRQLMYEGYGPRSSHMQAKCLIKKAWPDEATYHGTWKR